jgi:signal transduction histidine kinase/CheY-like chemotaxis protein
MTDLLGWLFSSQNFMPHGHCFLWQAGTLWLNVGSDALIAASYFAIPVALYHFVRRRKGEIAYIWVPLMFAAFILLCGTTHVMEIVTVWDPQYRAAGALKLLTGLVSFATVVILVRIMPRAMQLTTPRQLQAEVAARTAQLVALNIELQSEVAARTAAQEELQIADRRKDEFIAMLAHELRNPLAPIRHSLTLLDAADDDVQKRQWGTQVITRQVGRLARLLDDLMDISRMTRRRLALKIESVDVESLIATAVETATPWIKDKRHILKVSLPDKPLNVVVDPLRVSQAVANLLSNAAQYTAPGGHIDLTVLADAAGLTIVVKDTGVGFEPAALAAAFEMFTRGAPTAEHESGLGIGLALVKQLIGLHGGTVDAKSAGVGQGSEFRIHIPNAKVMSKPSDPGPTPSELPHAGRSGAVAVVDDNRDSADALALVLQVEGYDVMVGYSGKDALTLAQNEKPAAMILDIGMPDLSGYEVARRLRQEPWGRKVFLIAMTGWGQAKDKAIAQEAGFDLHFTKPFDPAELQRELAVFFDNRVPVA